MQLNFDQWWSLFHTECCLNKIFNIEVSLYITIPKSEMNRIFVNDSLLLISQNFKICYKCILIHNDIWFLFNVYLSSYLTKFCFYLGHICIVSVH